MNVPELTTQIPKALANPVVPDIQPAIGNVEYAKKVVPLNGKMVRWADPMTIGFPNFSSLVNMRYGDSHPRAVAGQTALNSVPLSYPSVKASFQFRKSSPPENHLLSQCWASGDVASGIIDYTTAIPGTGEFAASLLFGDTPGAEVGVLCHGPDDTVVYCNGIDTAIWGGDEAYCSGFVSFDPNGTFRKDYTSQVTNEINDAENRATLTRVLNGLDPTVVTMLHLDNSVDDGTSLHTWTAASLTYSTVDKVFGSHSAVFNGSTGYIHIADHSDFTLTSGIWTRAFRAKVSNLTYNRSLYYQESAEIKKVAFGTGTVAPAIGDTVNGQTSSATGVVIWIEVTDGTWSGGDAEGFIYMTGVTGTWQNGENIRVTTNVKAVTTSTASVEGTNYINMYVDTVGAVHLLLHTVYDGDTDLDVASSSGVIAIDTWYHIEFVENGDGYYVFVGQAGGVADIVASASSTKRPLDYTSDIYIGNDTVKKFQGKMDEVLMASTAYHTAPFLVPIKEYGGTYSTFFLVRSTRALDGIYLYPDTENASPATIKGYEWIGTQWQQVNNLIDGTQTGGAALAKAGRVAFDSTVGSSKIREMYGNVSYVYMFIVDGMDDGVTLYKCTVSAPMQEITDIWDGTDLQVQAFYRYNAYHNYKDFTLNVRDNSYVVTDADTFCQLGLMPTSQHIIIGADQQLMGVMIGIIPDHVNTVVGVIAEVFRSSDGVNWASVGNITDSTSTDGTSFSQGGAITWNPSSLTNEFESIVSRMTPLWHYKIEFSKTLSSDVRVFYVAGIPAPKTISNYSFAMAAQDRLFLGGNGNKVVYSSVGTNCVFNGEDSGEVIFEDAVNIIGGCSLFGLLGSSLYNLTLFFDRDMTFVLAGTIPNTDKHAVSFNIGLASKRTLAVASLPDGVAQGMNRNVAIWEGANGFYISDGRSPIPIHRDIRCYFDPNDDRCIPSAYKESSAGFLDVGRMEYHWTFYSGMSATRKELVFDLYRWKWFEIDRTTGMKIGVGVGVVDAYGVNHTVGFADDGLMYRLEYGTTFGGQEIVPYLEFGDFPMIEGDYLTETKAVKVNILAVRNEVSDSHLTYTHYSDADSSGTVVADCGALSGGTRRIKSITKTLNSTPSVLHSGSLSIATDDESCGLEPILMEYYYQPVRSRIKET